MKKEIIIKSLSLVNFKGIRELSVSFDERVTDIFGRNGSGKTTLLTHSLGYSLAKTAKTARNST